MLTIKNFPVLKFYIPVLHATEILYVQYFDRNERNLDDVQIYNILNSTKRSRIKMIVNMRLQNI